MEWGQERGEGLGVQFDGEAVLVEVEQDLGEV